MEATRTGGTVIGAPMQEMNIEAWAVSVRGSMKSNWCWFIPSILGLSAPSGWAQVTVATQSLLGAMNWPQQIPVQFGRCTTMNWPMSEASHTETLPNHVQKSNIYYFIHNKLLIITYLLIFSFRTIMARRAPVLFRRQSLIDFFLKGWKQRVGSQVDAAARARRGPSRFHQQVWVQRSHNMVCRRGLGIIFVFFIFPPS